MVDKCVQRKMPRPHPVILVETKPLWSNYHIGTQSLYNLISPFLHVEHANGKKLFGRPVSKRVIYNLKRKMEKSTNWLGWRAQLSIIESTHKCKNIKIIEFLYSACKYKTCTILFLTNNYISPIRPHRIIHLTIYEHLGRRKYIPYLYPICNV